MPAHNSHKGDQAKFLREGGTVLSASEQALLGDRSGKHLLHLQCNGGQETLSIAKHHGVASVTGVDISDAAIEHARMLVDNIDLTIPASFIRSDLYDWFAQNDQTFDLIFVSTGSLTWLSDLEAWAQGVAAALASEGELILYDIHPLLNVLDWDLNIVGHYMGGQHYQYDGIGDYVGESEGALALGDQSTENVESFQNPYPSHEFMWGLSDIIGNLLHAGLRIRDFHEYPYTEGYKPFGNMKRLSEQRWTMPDDAGQIPLMYHLIAAKSAS